MAIGKMRSEVLAVLNDKLQRRGVTLAPAAQQAVSHVFDATIGKFDRRQKRNGIDVWKRREFKKFILRETGKIAAALATAAKTGSLSGPATLRIARGVMQGTNKKCKAKVVDGQIVGFPYPAGETAKPGQGDVCTGFLDSNT